MQNDANAFLAGGDGGGFNGIEHNPRLLLQALTYLGHHRVTTGYAYGLNGTAVVWVVVIIGGE